MNDKAVLRISDLTKEYGSLRAVAGVSFSVDPGQIVGLLGPNGAGKTTTINMILGILQPTGGSIKVLGKNLQKCRSEVSTSMNFAAVYAHMPANLTVWQNLYVFSLLYGIRNRKERIASLLSEFDLRHLADTKSGVLSSGELSRLSLAKALMNEPRLLLLDEPTASLDPSVSQLIRERIKDYTNRTGAAVLWTSHNMGEIEDVCDQVLFLSHGSILLCGDPRALPAEHGKKDLEELFIAVAREPLGFKG
ncbi:MAG: putative ABC transporter ATP-binding protein YbhF [Syntrophorhabdaceae bacterium PtaU1.Bin034]|nr:MAG: putative ABC transporter ATP-binding protein YbhF [Syntrophorhabdaceae bacterium PtaU1.Bin034]